MSESFRQTYSLDSNGEAQVTGKSLDQKTNAEPSAAPVHRQGGAPSAVRVTVNSETGATTFESGAQRSSANAKTGPSATEAQAINKFGVPVGLDRAELDDVVTIPGKGDSSLRAWITMGEVRPRRDGGFELVNPLPSNPAAAKTQQEPNKPAALPAPAADPRDAVGIPGTPADVDAFQTALVAKTPMAFEGVITSIVKGAEPNWSAIAEQHRAEDPKAFAAAGEKAHAAYIASGQAALKNVGVVAFEEFESWARSQGDDADTAVRDLVSNKSVGRLQELGRKFVAQSNQKIASMLEAQGADVKIERGKVYISRKSLGLADVPARGDFGADRYMSFEAARAAGHITVE